MLYSAPPAKPKIWWPAWGSWSVLGQAVVARPIATGALNAITSEPPVARAYTSYPATLSTLSMRNASVQSERLPSRATEPITVPPGTLVAIRILLSYPPVCKHACLAGDRQVFAQRLYFSSSLGGAQDTVGSAVFVNPAVMTNDILA